MSNPPISFSKLKLALADVEFPSADVEGAVYKFLNVLEDDLNELEYEVDDPVLLALNELSQSVDEAMRDKFIAEKAVNDEALENDDLVDVADDEENLDIELDDIDDDDEDDGDEEEDLDDLDTFTVGDDDDDELYDDDEE